MIHLRNLPRYYIHRYLLYRKVSIGPSINESAATLRRIQWSDAKKAVREFLVAVFTPVLKVSSMTGKPSNGNKYRQSGDGVRPALDQEKLGDVIGKCACIFLLAMHEPKTELSERQAHSHPSF